MTYIYSKMEAVEAPRAGKTTELKVKRVPSQIRLMKTLQSICNHFEYSNQEHDEKKNLKKNPVYLNEKIILALNPKNYPLNFRDDVARLYISHGKTP